MSYNWVLVCGIGLLLLISQIAQGRESWIVSSSGKDVPGCGTKVSAACASIGYVLQKAPPTSRIMVDGSNTTYTYNVCGFKKPIIWTKSVTIVGILGVPRIGCPWHHESNHLWKFYPDDPQRMISFENIRIQNGRMTVNGRLGLTNATLYNTAIWTDDGCEKFEFEISNVLVERGLDWHGTEATMGPRSPVGSYIECEEIRGSMSSSLFEDVIMEIDAIWYGDLTVTNSNFSKKLAQETGVGGLNITLPWTHGRLEVRNCIFENQVHFEPIYSAVNIESAALRVESRTFTMGRNDVSDVNVTVIDSIFRHNERAISISRTFKHVNIAWCKFHDNFVMHAAAAIRLAISALVVTVKHCEFMNNAAGFNRHQAIPGNFEFDGDQVQITNERINGVISLVGKGGAIRIHKGRVLLHNCTFINNTARLLGGSVFVDRLGEVVMADSYFQNSDSGLIAMQGDILYSSGLVRISNITFDVNVADNHVSILRHGGTHWSMDVTQIYFKCPIGHRLSTVNATSHKIANGEGLLRSHKLDQLYYYCETCNNNQYSLDRGSIRYAVTGNESRYMTLMINGKQPFQTHPVLYTYSNITCHDCPYGAHCDNGIKAVANFWGYVSDNRAAFQHCPPGYCCSSTNCPSINTCAKDRVGTLCGQCKPGTSEALFSPNCLPDNHCTSFTWITPVTLLMASVYVLFLMYQKDLRDSLSKWTLTWDYDICCTKCKTETQPAATTNGQTVRCRETHNPEEEPALNGNPTSSTDVPHAKKLGAEGGFMVILFYYFQDALLLNIESVYSKNMSEFERRMKSFLLGLFRFRLDFYQFLEDVCIYPGMQPVSKLLLKSLFVPYVIMTFGFLYAVAALKKRLTTKQQVPNEQRLHRFLCNTTFSGRLAGGFTLAMLFTYQKLATATFTLLNCVPVADKSVLFLDGTNECFGGWQFAIMTYALVSVIPFSVILMVGPPLLRQKRISLSQFFIGCLFPLPSLIIWAVRNVKRKPIMREVALKEDTRIVLELLQGPFKEHDSPSVLGQLCWAGVLLARRLILFMCYTFINDVLVRLLCMMSACFIILMHHMYVQPYKNSRGNVAGSFSAAALLVVGSINLLKASFEAAEYIPKGPYKLLMHICVEIENTLVLWLPLAGVCSILFLILLKVVFTSANAIYLRGLRGSRQSAPNPHLPT